MFVVWGYGQVESVAVDQLPKEDMPSAREAAENWRVRNYRGTRLPLLGKVLALQLGEATRVGINIDGTGWTTNNLPRGRYEFVVGQYFEIKLLDPTYARIYLDDKLLDLTLIPDRPYRARIGRM